MKEPGLITSFGPVVLQIDTQRNQALITFKQITEAQLNPEVIRQIIVLEYFLYIKTVVTFTWQ